MTNSTGTVLKKTFSDKIKLLWSTSGDSDAGGAEEKPQMLLSYLPVYDGGGGEDDVGMLEEAHAVPLLQQVVHRQNLLNKLELCQKEGEY